MSFAPLYPSPTWECRICSKTNPGDIGFCVRCRGGSIQPLGGLLAGERPYFPAWHARKAGFSVSRTMLQADRPISQYQLAQ